MIPSQQHQNVSSVHAASREARTPSSSFDHGATDSMKRLLSHCTSLINHINSQSLLSIRHLQHLRSPPSQRCLSTSPNSVDAARQAAIALSRTRSLSREIFALDSLRQCAEVLLAELCKACLDPAHHMSRQQVYSNGPKHCAPPSWHSSPGPRLRHSEARLAAMKERRLWLLRWIDGSQESGMKENWIGMWSIFEVV
jgi:hypothetical protein